MIHSSKLSVVNYSFLDSTVTLHQRRAGASSISKDRFRLIEVNDYDSMKQRTCILNQTTCVNFVSDILFGVCAVRIWGVATEFPEWLIECSQLHVSRFQPFDPWWRGRYVASKRQDPIAQWSIGISQMNGILSYTSARDSKLASFALPRDYFQSPLYLSFTLLPSCWSNREDGIKVDIQKIECGGGGELKLDWFGSS